MFLYFLQINCFYLFHNKTQRFLGEAKPSGGASKFTNLNYPSPIAGIDRAIDFKVSSGQMINGAPTIIIEKSGDKALDVSGGKESNSSPLIFYKTHRGKAQSLQLMFVKENNFVLGFRSKCLKYNETFNGFVTGDCKNLAGSTFDIYYEVPPTPNLVKEQTFKLSQRNGGDLPIENEYYKSDSPILATSEPRVIEEIVFADGKATTRSLVDDEKNDVKFGYAPVKIRSSQATLGKDKGGAKPQKSNKHSSKHHFLDDECAHSDSQGSSHFTSESNADDLHNLVQHEAAQHGYPNDDNSISHKSSLGLYI